jgi:small-conductance mechanosensitive channel
MTDATPTPSTPEQPVAAPVAAPAAAAPKQTLSLVGFIIGIASVVFAWTFILGVGGGIAAVILSRRGKKSEPGAPTWMTTVGLITGIAGIVLGVILGLITVVGFIASFLIPAAVIGSYGN